MGLVCVYRKQEIAVSVFIEEVSAFVEKIAFKEDLFMFVGDLGDFNLWVDVEDDANAIQMLMYLDKVRSYKSYKCYKPKWTHLGPNIC